MAERFFGSRKGERTAHRQYTTRQEARTDVIESIEMFSNSVRLHSYLGYHRPHDYEALRHVASLSVRFSLTITIPTEDWHQTPLSVRLVLLTLLKRLEVLEARLTQNSSNSSRHRQSMRL